MTILACKPGESTKTPSQTLPKCEDLQSEIEQHEANGEVVSAILDRMLECEEEAGEISGQVNE